MRTSSEQPESEPVPSHETEDVTEHTGLYIIGNRIQDTKADVYPFLTLLADIIKRAANTPSPNNNQENGANE